MWTEKKKVGGLILGRPTTRHGHGMSGLAPWAVLVSYLCRALIKKKWAQPTNLVGRAGLVGRRSSTAHWPSLTIGLLNANVPSINLKTHHGFADGYTR